MRKLTMAAFSLAAATLFSHYLLPHSLLPLCCGIAALASAAGLLFHGHIRLRIFIILPSLAFGFLWSWLFTTLFISPHMALHGESAAVTATVRGYPSEASRGFRIDCVVHRESVGGVGARIYYYEDIPLSPGDEISFTARFLRTDGSADGTERLDALTARGAFLMGYVSGKIEKTGSDTGLLYFPQRLADAVSDMIGNIFGDDTAPFMRALLVGRRGDIDRDTALTSSLSASGVSHIVAISGMHVSFLMGFLSAFIKNKRLFSFYGIPVLFLFMAMTGFTPSVTRAGIMQIFLICAPLFKRESDSLTALSAALFLLLLINPYSVASAGLQLSFAATLGIILFTSRIDAALNDHLRESRRLCNKFVKAFASFIVTSLATTVGALVFTLPLTAIHFGVVSLISPVANLLVIWPVSLAFPLGIIACVLGFIFVPLGAIAAVPAAIIVRFIILTARALAGLPFASVYASNTHILLWLAFVYILFVTLALLRVRVRQYILPACLSVTLLCAVLLLSPLLPFTGTSSITALDVGQGLSVVVDSGGDTVIVDCGSSSGESAGAVAHGFLLNRGQSSVSLLVLTHFHDDHINGVEYLLSRISVAALAIPDPEDSYAAEDIIELARRRGTEIIYVTEPVEIALGDVNMLIYPPLVSGGSDNENESGLAILCTGGVNALITGDMDSVGERRLMRYYDIPDIDVLLVGHHGSRYSTSDELLSMAAPEIAIISVGENSYGHPTEETLERLARRSVAVFRTDIQGNVTVGGFE